MNVEAATRQLLPMPELATVDAPWLRAMRHGLVITDQARLARSIAYGLDFEWEDLGQDARDELWNIAGLVIGIAGGTIRLKPGKDRVHG